MSRELRSPRAAQQHQLPFLTFADIGVRPVALLNTSREIVILLAALLFDVHIDHPPQLDVVLDLPLRRRPRRQHAAGECTRRRIDKLAARRVLAELHRTFLRERLLQIRCRQRPAVQPQPRHA